MTKINLNFWKIDTSYIYKKVEKIVIIETEENISSGFDLFLTIKQSKKSAKKYEFLKTKKESLLVLTTNSKLNSLLENKLTRTKISRLDYRWIRTSHLTSCHLKFPWISNMISSNRFTTFSWLCRPTRTVTNPFLISYVLICITYMEIIDNCKKLNLLK